MLKHLKFYTQIVAISIFAFTMLMSKVGAQSYTGTQMPSSNEKIVFISHRDGSNQIYTMNTDGSDQKRISKTAISKYWPRVSPDGKKIAYTNYNSALMIVNIDGRNARRISRRNEKCYTASWSPNGKKVIFSSTRGGYKNSNGKPVDNIWVMNLDGSNAQQLTFTNFEDTSPCFSPDSKKIVFTSMRDPIEFSVLDKAYITRNRQIYIMNADGSNQQRLTALNPAIVYDDPNISPDGKKIAYKMKDSMGDDTKWAHVYVMNLDGSHPLRLSKLDALDDNPVWSPDGKKIIIDRTFKRYDQIIIMDRDGSHVRQLTYTSASNYTASFFTSQKFFSTVNN